MSENTQINAAYASKLVDYFRIAKSIRATALERFFLPRIGKDNANAANASTKIVRNQAALTFQIQALVSLALMCILLLSVSVLKVSVTVLLVFLLIITRLMPKFSVLLGQYHNFSAYYPALETVYTLIADCQAAKEQDNLQGLTFGKLKKELAVRALTYHFPTQPNPTLKELTLTIPAHSFIAIVGKTGCGKSTFLELLSGLRRPTTGSIEIDGVPLEEYKLISYREKIAYVTQEGSLFSGTIKENVTCFNEVLSDKLVAALKTAQIYDFIEGLPDGINTEVGEAGVRLSGGQKQRLTIARALVREPEILLLDEATSALDAESEKCFQVALDKIASQYTMIVVAHRLSTIQKADQIYVMHDGSIVEHGTYTALLQRGGYFSRLALESNEP